HKTRAIVEKNGEIAIKQTRAVFTLVSSIQDEVHRFAIGYHHKKQRKSMLTMQLTDIEGVGKKRAENLIKYFKDINKIATADKEELLKVQGITDKIAENIYDFYRK
ncbi:MAG: helix-hairpin-helix domain-containing protein, partial [Clostridia bacterium]|nr:helix-hairpin-helix domain-containing protein [Clostridia bacterium]